MAHILSVLVDISMKAYVYYHCYKTSRSVTVHRETVWRTTDSSVLLIALRVIIRMYYCTGCFQPSTLYKPGCFNNIVTLHYDVFSSS